MMKLELAHDVIALKVGEKISGEEKEFRSMENFLSKRYEEYKERGNAALLSKDDLEFINPYLKRLSLINENRTFIQLSKNKVRNKYITLAVFALIISTIILIFSAISFQNYKIVSDQKEKVEQASDELDQKEKKLQGINHELVRKKREATESEKESDTLAQKLSENKRKINLLNSEYTQKIKRISDMFRQYRSEGNKEDAYSKMISDPTRWSKNLGEISWEEAKSKCAQLGGGFKLPARKDWLIIFNSSHDTFLAWKSEGSVWYWTRDEKSPSEAFGFLFDQGVTHFEDKNVKWHVKCVR